MGKWKTIKAETQVKVFELYRWEQDQLKRPEYNFIGTYVLYDYRNRILYAGITEDREIGYRVREHLNDKGVKAEKYLCKQLDHAKGEFTGYNTGYENCVYRIELYKFKKKMAHTWFEQYLITQFNPPCNFQGRTDLTAENPLERIREWDKKGKHISAPPSMDAWSSYEKEAAKMRRRIEEVVLKDVAKRMEYDYSYFCPIDSDLSKFPNRFYPTEEEFVEELIQKLYDTKRVSYTKKQIYEMARLIGLSGNRVELRRLKVEEPIDISMLVP
jgi:hypothetical protein